MRGGHLRSTFISSKTVILTGNLCLTDNFSNKNGFEIENSQMEKKIFSLFLALKSLNISILKLLTECKNQRIRFFRICHQISFFDKKHQQLNNKKSL